MEHILDLAEILLDVSLDGLHLLLGVDPVSYTHLDVYKRQAVTGGKILNVTPERRAQVIILQFVPDSTPSGYACHVTTSQSR